MRKKFSLEKLPNASYIPNYIKDPQKLFEQVKNLKSNQKCSKEIEKNENKFQIAGAPGPVVASFHLDEIPNFIQELIEKMKQDEIFGDLKPFQVSMNNYLTDDFSLSVFFLFLKEKATQRLQRTTSNHHFFRFHHCFGFLSSSFKPLQHYDRIFRFWS
jgi:hypothetical protein